MKISDFDFDISKYVILRHNETHHYYAVKRKEWELARDTVRANSRLGINDVIQVRATFLGKNLETKQLVLSNLVQKLSFTSFKGVLIKMP